MALRALIGFDHLPTGAAGAPAGSEWMGGFYLDTDRLAGNLIAKATNTNNHGLQIAAVGGKRYLATRDIIANSNTRTAMGFQFNKYISPSSTQVIVGFRYRVVKKPGSGTVSLGTMGAFALFQTSTNIVSATNLAGTSFSCSNVFGTAAVDALNNVGFYEAFVEMVFTFSTRIAQFYVDGVLTYTTTAMATGHGAINAGVVFLSALSLNNEPQKFLTDLYIADTLVEGHNQIVAPVGPIVVSPVIVDSAVGPDWTTSDNSSIPAVLNTKIADLNFIPNVLSPVDDDTLVLGIAVPVEETDNILGLSLFTSYMKEASAIQLFSKVAVGANETSEVEQPGTGNSAVWNNRVGLMFTAPDGEPWTKDKLDQTSITLRYVAG